MRRSEVVVLPYDPRWREGFEAIRARILPVVEAFASAVEHVGSTAVPGLAAKPVIDVDVVVASPEASVAAIRALEGIGYAHRGDLGVPGREAMREPVGAARQNLYVCLEKAEALRNHILVRDHLRSHPESAVAYGALKLELARRFPEDIDGYVDGKTEFLLGVLRAAGFEEAALRRIAAINRRPSGK